MYHDVTPPPPQDALKSNVTVIHLVKATPKRRVTTGELVNLGVNKPKGKYMYTVDRPGLFCPVLSLRFV